MSDRTKVLTELDEQRCLIEAQRVEMQRMKRHIMLQRELIGLIYAELDTVKARLPFSGQLPREPGNGHERVMAP
jgi:hypothetical protein